MPENIISVISFCALLEWLARAALGVLAIMSVQIISPRVHMNTVVRSRIVISILNGV